MSWFIFIVSLGTIVAISEFRDWLARRELSRRTLKMKPLIPSVWNQDIINYYKHNPTRRQL